MKTIHALGAVFSVFALAACGADATRYVSPTGDDTRDGLSLGKAKATLAAAIADLGEDGGTVYIDDGDYAFTSDTDTAVTITNPVHVVGLSRDATKVTITCTGTPTRNFVLDNANCSLEHVTISGGSSGYGMSIALRQGVVADCIICDASWNSWENRGALYAFGGCVTRCIFRNNTGYFGGSALGAEGSAIIENCLFTENNVPNGAEWGGGTVNLGGSAKLVNCTIVANRGTVSSGVNAGGNSAVVNCAIYGNTTTSDTSGHGHIWWNSSAKFSYCAAEDPINDTCIAPDPGFRDAAHGDYSLSPASGLIDCGSVYADTGAACATDFAGNVRESGGGVDIGCYEYTLPLNGYDAGITASAAEGMTGVPVTFTATVFHPGTDMPRYYFWDFGEGGTVETQTPTIAHSFAAAGVKDVSVTVNFVSSANVTATLRSAVDIRPDTVYVATSGTDAYPYDTPATAARDLQTAIAAAGRGATVLVADGTYAPVDDAGFLVEKEVTIRSISGNPAACILTESKAEGERRVLRLNHAQALVAGLTLAGGESSGHMGNGGTLAIGILGGTVSNCVLRAGRAVSWGGDGALVHMQAGRLTHSVLEDGLCLDNDSAKSARPRSANVAIQNGQVDNCLIRGFNKDWGNQNIVTVYKGGRLLNCTIVDGLCGNAGGDEATACAAVRAEEGARVENCAIAGVRYANGDNTFSVRAWTGSAASFDHCATDTAEPINASCITITTSAFRDFAHQDYRPRPGSVLLNKGRTNELADGTDLGGDRRKFGAQDIGCYEFARAGFALTLR